MLWNTTKILETLATIKEATANHKEDLNEFKDNFNKHVEKEERETVESSKKMDAIRINIEKIECPYHDKILKLERRFHDSQKIGEGRRVTDMEERVKAKVIEVKERATKDENIAKAISSLKTSRKYQWATSSGIYIILGIILKKIFTS